MPQVWHSACANIGASTAELACPNWLNGAWPTSAPGVGEEIAWQRPAQPERAARRHRQPALLQVAGALDGRGDRLVIDPGQQLLQGRVVLPGGPAADPGR